jgi:small subunit ribosomal protein S9
MSDTDRPEQTETQPAAGAEEAPASPAETSTEPAAPTATPPAEAPTEQHIPHDAPVPEAPTPAPAPVRRAAAPSGSWWWGTGRRKAAVARVRIRPGSGQLVVNKKKYDEFFCTERDRKDVMEPLKRVNMTNNVDVHVNVRGGGTTGQAGAIVLGIARALSAYDPNLEAALRDGGFMTRDPRRVERKKYGQPGARRRFQFSKR